MNGMTQATMCLSTLLDTENFPEAGCFPISGDVFFQTSCFLSRMFVLLWATDNKMPCPKLDSQPDNGLIATWATQDAKTVLILAVKSNGELDCLDYFTTTDHETYNPDPQIACTLLKEMMA